MVTVEEKRDGFDLVLSVPELKDVRKQFKFIDFLGKGGLFCSILCLFAIFVADEKLLFLVFGGCAVVVLIVSLSGIFYNMKVRKPLAGLQEAVAAKLFDECQVDATERINLVNSNSDFIVRQPDGEEMFWDVKHLDNEGLIGLKSRFRS